MTRRGVCGIGIFLLCDVADRYQKSKSEVDVAYMVKATVFKDVSCVQDRNIEGRGVL